MYKIFGLKNQQIESLGLGIFDGFHFGHQELAKYCSHLLTFWPHPDVFLSKNKDLKMLTTLRELRYYQKKLVVLRFNYYISQLQPENFLDQIILKELNPQRIVVGYDFNFGYKKEGDYQLLKIWTAKNKIELIQVKPATINDQIVKSSLIRNLILENKFNQAVNLLNHAYLIIGKVIKGEGRGRRLGFPTANLQIPMHKLIPGKGIYKGKVLVENKSYSALIYLGNKPTFHRNFQNSVEVYIKGFRDNIYDKQIKVFLELKIRDEQIFSNEQDLILQIQKDLEQI